MMMIAYRPMATTLTQVRNLFWGWHLLPAALKWRYFSTMPDFGSTLTKLQAAACKPWYDHMYEAPLMKAIVNELRKVMVTSNVNYDDYNIVDGIFVQLFDAAYAAVTNTGQPLQGLNVPFDERPAVASYQGNVRRAAVAMPAAAAAAAAADTDLIDALLRPAEGDDYNEDEDEEGMPDYLPLL